jgi:hypothetical protein
VAELLDSCPNLSGPLRLSHCHDSRGAANGTTAI